VTEGRGYPLVLYINSRRPSVRPSDDVLRFNSSTEPARIVGFGKRDSEKRDLAENGI
jgi:hypothetical protein